MNEKALENAKKIIDEVVSNGNLRKWKLTLSEFHEFSQCVYDFAGLKKPCADTISKRVKDLLVQCGFSATEKGIGWQIA